MIQDQIAIQLKEVAKFKEKLKEIKKDIKEEEKIQEEDYLELKKTYKELRKQIKEKEEECENDLKTDNSYNQLRELRLKAEEDLALAQQKLFALIDKLPTKFFEMEVEIEESKVKFQVQPQMKVFLNGKEEKRRS